MSEQVDRFTFALNTKVNGRGKPEGNGGQGEIILKLDPIDFEIADFRFKFAKWVRKNIICEHESVHHNSAEEVFP